MRIDRIEASKHKRGRVLVFLADGSLLKVTEQELLTFGLRSGDELDEEILTRLKEAAGVSNIKTTAADLVGRRAMSRRDLEKKLQEKGASETEARYAGEWLEAIGALDDGSIARAHRAFLSQAGAVALEGLCLEGVAGGWYNLICLPLKLAGSDGAPCRAVLVREDAE